MNAANVSSQKSKGLKNIFVSYREKDSSGETGRLVDALKQHFLEDQIFLDIDKIEPGVDFTDAISKSLECCDVMLAVIGPNWLGENQANHTSRIKDPNDWVRLEIANALQRNVRVVPVLVDGAALPTAEQLPDDLQSLLRRQSYEISNKRWRYDTDQLIEFLEKSFGILPRRVEPVATVSKPSGISKAVKGVLISVGGFFILIMLLYAMGVGREDKTDPVQNQNNLPNQPANLYADSAINNTDDNVENATNVATDIGGTWNDFNGLYYMVLTQNGSQLDIKSYALTGQKTGEGLGTINGNMVTFKIAIANFGMISANAEVTSGGDNIKGTTSIENNGYTYSEPLHLIKDGN